MDIDRIEAVARVLRESPRLTEIEVRDGERVLRLRRPAPVVKPRRSPTGVAGTGTTQSGGNQNGVSGTSSLDHSGGQTGSASRTNVVTVTAQLVGVFRGNRPAVVSPGDTVKANQVIGHIEAMRLMNDCPAPTSGRVQAVLVQEGQPVEYGQPLFEIVPEEAT